MPPKNTSEKKRKGKGQESNQKNTLNVAKKAKTLETVEDSDESVSSDSEPSSSSDEDEQLFMKLPSAQGTAGDSSDAIVDDENGDDTCNAEETPKDGDDDSSDWESAGETSDDEADTVEAGHFSGEDSTGEEEEEEEDEVVQAIRRAVEPQTRTKPPSLDVNSMVADLSFHPEADIIAVATMDGPIHVYQYTNEKCTLSARLKHHKKSCRALEFGIGGSHLFSASKDKSVAVVDTTTMKITQRLKKAHDSALYCVRPMTEHVWASGDEDGFVKVWDLRRSTPTPVVVFKEMEEFVSNMMTDEEKRLLICTSGEGSLTAFNTRARKMEAQSEMYESEMNCLGLIRNETKLITGLASGNMYVFDMGSFGYHSDSFGDHPDAVNALIPVTEDVVVTACEDGKIRAVRLFPHRYLGVVGHHDGFPIERLDISSCGQFLASSSHDSVVKFWNLSFIEDMEAPKECKSLRNKKRSQRKDKIEHQLPSSNVRNTSEFFAEMENE